MNKLSPENWMYGMRWREIKHHKGVYKNCLICDIFTVILVLKNVCVMVGYNGDKVILKIYLSFKQRNL